MAMRRLQYRHLVTLTLLIAAGTAGNYFSIPLFFGADFLFGSVATLLIVRLYGAWWGVLAALVINAYTLVLWGHPIGMVVFALEALVVGLLLRRWPGTSLLLLDGLFWVLLAPAFNWFTLASVINLDTTGVTLVVLKQSVNGLFNAMLAVLALTHLPLHRWLPSTDQPYRVSLGAGFFNLLVTFLMVPALALTIQASRHELQRTNEEVAGILAAESRNVSNYIHLWRQRYLRRIQELGEMAAEEGMVPSDKLLATLQFLLDTSPDFERIAIITPNGGVVAAVSSDGSPAEAVDSINLNEVKQRLELVVSEVHATLVSPDSPVVTVSQPIIRNGRLIGIAQGMLSPDYANSLLTRPSDLHPIHLTLVDRTGNVFGSSRPDIKPLQQFDPRAGSDVSWLDTGRYHLFPADQSAALNRWRDSVAVREAEIPGVGDWRLVAEVSLEPYRTRLYQVYIDSLLTVFGLMVTALLLSALLSRWITGPLLRLTTITRSLPDRLKGGEPIRWPSSSITEVDSLSADVRWMADVLREQFDEIERDARQQRRLLSAAMEATDVPVIITDQARRIVYVNPPFLEEYGYAPDEVLGRRPASFLRGPFTDQASVRRLEEAIRLGQAVVVDIVNQRKDGTLVDVELILSPIHDGKGLITHFVSIMRDISERKALERINSQFVVSLSHELRKPLTAIRGALSLLTAQITQGQDPRTTGLMQTATSNADQLISLISGILELEEVESGRAILRRESLSASQLVGRAVQEVRPLFDGRRVSLQVEVPDLPVLADERHVLQVLTTLLRHAAASSGEGTQVTLTARSVAGDVLFALQDQRPGMEPAVASRLLRAYEHGRLSGSNLDLAIAKAVIEQLEGQVWVVSELDQGCTLFFTLRGAGSEAVRRSCSVLVHAEQSRAERISSALTPEGLQVDLVYSANDAWIALENGTYTVVLLDESIPGGGREFLTRLRQSERHADLPVILIDPTREKVGGWSLLSSGAWVIDAHDATRLKEAIRYACGQI